MTDYPESYDWIPFYKEFADKLLQYKDRRKELIAILNEIFDKIKNSTKGITNPFRDETTGKEIIDVCPFTVVASFNYNGLKDNTRQKIIGGFKEKFGLESPVPTSFSGIPNLPPRNEGIDKIPHLWDFFEKALIYADDPSEDSRKSFETKYDTIRWNLTVGLFWIRPEQFLSLDTKNREQINNMNLFPEKLKRHQPLTGEKYLSLCDTVSSYLNRPDSPVHTFYEFSKCAYEMDVTESQNTVTEKNKIWIYKPGEGASMWKFFYPKGVMSIGWDYLGDLSHYDSKEKIAEKLTKIYGGNQAVNAKMVWNFSHEMKIGDVILSCSGRSEIIGLGVVTSDYFYDEINYGEDINATHYYHYRKVDWKYKTKMELDEGEILPMNTISPFSEKYRDVYNRYLEQIKQEDSSFNVDDLKYYSPTVPEDETMKAFLRKKNIILYGPPGTGKTYNTVIRAVSIIEKKNQVNEKFDLVNKRFEDYRENGQIVFVTFHQSYGYEDFIEGIKPNVFGREIRYRLEPGVFRKICETALENPEENYVLVIDEINRGNISKIFGELITLIEDSKRLGNPEEMKVALPYSKKPFGVPNNLYLIGTMNTADNSLTRIDAALRRRFHFIEMMPDYDVLENANIKIEGEKSIEVSTLLKFMNRRIESLLDRDHQLGHAYFWKLNEPVNQNLNTLGDIFKDKIIPLLQEYFYDDYKKIQLVLGDSEENKDEDFIRSRNLNNVRLFKQNPDEAVNTTYYINEAAFENPEAYLKIYEGYSLDETKDTDAE